LASRVLDTPAIRSFLHERMTNPRQRRKLRGGKTTRRSRGTNLRNLKITEPLLQDSWDSTRTVKENYESIGLAVSVNKDVGSRRVTKDMQAWKARRDEAFAAVAKERAAAEEAAARTGTLAMVPLDQGEEAVFAELNGIFDVSTNTSKPVIAQLEKLANEETAKEVRFLNEDDTEYIANLRAHHGANVVKMARDLRLNYLQKTPRQLERMLETFTFMLEQLPTELK
jgi:hypothetical protein